MLKRAWKVVRENVGAIVSVLSLFGYASIAALVDDARSALADRPIVVLLLSALAFAAGAGVAWFVLTKSRWAKRRRKVERLTQCFATMSEKRRRMVATALDKGEVRAWSLDEDATSLCNMGILGMPPIVSRIGEVGFSVQPAVVLEIREHRDEWLGM